MAPGVENGGLGLGRQDRSLDTFACSSCNSCTLVDLHRTVPREISKKLVACKGQERDGCAGGSGSEGRWCRGPKQKVRHEAVISRRAEASKGVVGWTSLTSLRGEGPLKVSREESGKDFGVTAGGGSASITRPQAETD